MGKDQRILAQNSCRRLDSTLADSLLTLNHLYLGTGARTVLSTRWAVDNITTAIFCRLYWANRWNKDSPGRAMQKAQTSLRLMSGEEFRLNYSEEIKQHLRKYGRAIQDHRRCLEAQYQQEKIDEATYKSQTGKITEFYAKVIELLGKPGEAGIIDHLCTEQYPFAHPYYYWAGFTCRELA